MRGIIKVLCGTTALWSYGGELARRRATALMTFEGLKEGEQVLNFYNGGLGSMGGGPGPKFGVAFTSTAVALTHGNYGEEPSPPTVMTHRSKHRAYERPSRRR